MTQGEPADPFRDLERDSPERRRWLADQRRRCASYLAELPLTAELRDHHEALARRPSCPLHRRRGALSFYEAREGDELAKIWVDGPGGSRVLVDPNLIAGAPDLCLLDWFPAPDGSRLAYRLARAGSSFAALHLVDVESGAAIGEPIPAALNPVAHAWHTDNRVAWLPDASGFYYTRRPARIPAGEERYHQKLWLHRLGTPWCDDDLVFGEALTPAQVPYPRLAIDVRSLLVVVVDWSGTKPRSHLWLRPQGCRAFVPIATELVGFAQAELDGDRVFIRSDHQAPHGAIWSLAIADPEAPPRAVIREGTGTIGHWRVVGDHLIVETREPIHSRLWIHSRTGERLAEVELPGLGCVTALCADPGARGATVAFSTPLRSRTVLSLDPSTRTCVLIRGPNHALDPERYIVRQLRARARDGAELPLFLVHRRDLVLDGDNPTVIHMYGGFGVSVRPSFRAEAVPFIERGGVFAIACIRGGGELGRSWHEAGMRERKQTVFDDLVAVAEYLITAGVTRPARLGCIGTSNGGLVVSAVATQRPDLFAAVVVRAPVTDMARFHLGPGSRHWIAEYGDPDDPTQLANLLAYSPIHAKISEREMPALLVVCGESDDRVPPWHGYKLVATWQREVGFQRPILLRVEHDAGHRGASAASLVIARHAEIWSFLSTQLTKGSGDSVCSRKHPDV